MNQKKAKALRRAVREELNLKVNMPQAKYGFFRDKLERIRYKRIQVIQVPQSVNNTRLAKSLYRGSVKLAVKDLRKRVRLMVSLGVYKVA